MLGDRTWITNYLITTSWTAAHVNWTLVCIWQTLYFLRFQLCYAHLFFSFQNRRFSICISFSFWKKEKPSVLKLKLKVFIKVFIKFEDRSLLQFGGHSFKMSTNVYYFWPPTPIPLTFFTSIHWQLRLIFNPPPTGWTLTYH